MKILFASYNFGNKVVGGGQQSVKIVADELIARGHGVDVLYVNEPPRIWDDPSGISRLEISSKNIYWHPKERPGAASRFAWHAVDRYMGLNYNTFVRFISKSKPDVVHTNVMSGLTVDIWRAAHFLGVPVVHTTHDYYLLCVNSGMRVASGNCESQCSACQLFSIKSRSYARKYVKGVAYISSHMRSVHERAGVFAEDVAVGMIAGAYRPVNPRIDLSSRGVASSIRFGFLGRVAPDKGVDLLIESFVNASINGAELVIGGLGDDAYVSALKVKASGANVKFLGRVKPEDFFQAIDVLIVPSTWNEPSGRVVYEAGTTLVPVAVSNRGGLPELVLHGQRGWVFEPTSSGELTSLLLRIAGNPDEIRLKSSAWLGAEVDFSPETVTDQTLGLYDAVIN